MDKQIFAKIFVMIIIISMITASVILAIYGIDKGAVGFGIAAFIISLLEIITSF